MLYILIFIFALLGVAATSFCQFIYFLWFKNSYRFTYLVRAAVAIFIVVIIKLVLKFS